MYEYNRPRLKQESKRLLRKASPGVYLVALIYLVLTYLPNIIMQRSLYPALMKAAGDPQAMMQAYENWAVNNSGIGLSIASWAMQIFLMIVGFGFMRYCLYAARDQENGGPATLFCGFQDFWRVFSCAILQYVYILLWSMLFIIPGIIKAFAYSQSYYILADNRDMTANQCITASREMMQGHKWDWFVLQLSFLGWEIVSAFTLGILQVWLTPYERIADAGFYDGLSGWQPEAPEAPEQPPQDDRPRVDDYWKN
jgi:uncharacterized membrane protein